MKRVLKVSEIGNPILEKKCKEVDLKRNKRT